MSTYLYGKKSPDATFCVRGIGVYDAAACGKIRFLIPRKDINADPEPPYRGAEREESEFSDALIRARSESAALYRKTLAAAGEEAASIFEIHEMLLADPDFIDMVKSGISSGLGAIAAVRAAGESLAAIFEGMEDEYLSARGADMRDIAARVCRILSGESENGQKSDGEPEILVCHDLSPGDTVSLDTAAVAGFVTFGGSVNSHTAILARAMGIPALVRAEEFGPEFDGARAIIDAERGRLCINPTPEEMLEYAERAEQSAAEKSRLSTLTALPAVTKSGRRVALFANIGSVTEAKAAHAAGAEGIGLFRSEFLFLGNRSLPSENEQYEAYREVAELMRDRPGAVVIRTLDVGADKSLPYLDEQKEDNPALGMRGIRLCLSRTDIFRTQLRAILRASAHGKIAIMLPMVSNSDEIRRAKLLLAEEKNKLRYEEIDFDQNIGLGIMIETPAAALMAEELAGDCDFFSVGTNDLCQYTLAADRQNPDLSYLTEGEDALEPVLKLIRMAAEGIHRAGGERWIGICGELAADTSLTARLLACGADELSVSPPYISRVKDKIRNLD